MRFFNIHSVAKHEKFEEKNFFREKISLPKKLKGGTLWDFPTSILSQNIKKMQGTLWEKNPKKSRTVPKKNRKGGPFSPVRACR